MNDPYEAQRQLQELQQASKIGRGLGGSSLCGRRQHCPCATWRWRSFPRYRRGRHWLRADPGYRNVRSAQHCADAWDRNHPESPRHTHRRASEQRASGRGETFGREASERRAGPHPSGHQRGNRARYPLPTMSLKRQISERAADVPWPPGISLFSTVPHAETALVLPEAHVIILYRAAQ